MMLLVIEDKVELLQQRIKELNLNVLASMTDQILIDLLKSTEQDLQTLINLPTVESIEQ